MRKKPGALQPWCTSQASAGLGFSSNRVTRQSFFNGQIILLAVSDKQMAPLCASLEKKERVKGIEPS